MGLALHSPVLNSLFPVSGFPFALFVGPGSAALGRGQLFSNANVLAMSAAIDRGAQ